MPPNISLRDYFAGQALAGIMVNQKYSLYPEEERARYAFEIADEMVKASGDKLSNVKKLSKDHCPICSCLFEDKMTSPLQGRDGSCKCYCMHKSFSGNAGGQPSGSCLA